MATTTPNFGWSVPTSTDLVKDGATAIETLGDSIDASMADLKGGTTGQVLKKNSNTDMDFVWSADSAGMSNPMTTTGDTIYSSSGSTPARLGIGSSGQVLSVSGGLPAWVTPAGSGVKQVVTATTTSGTSTSSSSYVDVTGLSATITPSSSSSKILIFISSPYCDHYVSGSSTSLTGKFQILRNATVVVGDGYRALSNYASTASFDNNMPFSQSAVDSPASTSALTYKLQIKVNSGTWEWATPAGVPASIILMEI